MWEIFSERVCVCVRWCACVRAWHLRMLSWWRYFCTGLDSFKPPSSPSPPKSCDWLAEDYRYAGRIKYGTHTYERIWEQIILACVRVGTWEEWEVESEQIYGRKFKNIHVFNEYPEIYIVNYTLSVYGCLGDCVFVFVKYSTIEKEIRQQLGTAHEATCALWGVCITLRRTRRTLCPYSMREQGHMISGTLLLEMAMGELKCCQAWFKGHTMSGMLSNAACYLAHRHLEFWRTCNFFFYKKSSEGRQK